MKRWIFSRHWTARIFAPIFGGFLGPSVGYVLNPHPSVSKFWIGVVFSTLVFAIWKEVVDVFLKPQKRKT